MSQTPKINQQLQDSLALRGYNGNIAFGAGKLPDFAIPRTTACTTLYIHLDNLTTAALAGLSLLGYVISRRKGLYHQGFAVAFGLTFVLDYAHRV